MSSSPQPLQELHDLLDLIADGDFSEKVRTQLNLLLRDNLDLQTVYLEYLALHAALAWDAVERPSNMDRIVGPLPAVSVSLAAKPVRHTRRLASRVIAMAASLLLVGYFVTIVGLLAWDRLRRTDDHERIAAQPRATEPAQLTRADDARWETPTVAATTHESIPRTLQVRSGLAELKFARGAKVVVEGPAEFEVRTAQAGFLKFGKLVARVPHEASGFVVDTPTASIVDLGTEFGVEVNPASGTTEVHVLRGTVETTRHAKNSSSTAEKPIRLEAGSAIRISRNKKSDEPIAFDDKKFMSAQAASADASFDQSPLVRVIPLGNLFDDPRGIPLTKAIATDTFRATAEIDDLGVQCVFYGGDPAKLINPHLCFDATSLGWNDLHICSVTNDAWGDLTEFADGGEALGGIRTQGTPIGHNEPKMEDGIGMHANALITFDLDKIRAAGKLHGRKLEFLCDRAGINDARAGDKRASVHMAVLVSDAIRVRTAVVDGQDAKVAEEAGIWSVVPPTGEPLRADGRFCSFRFAIPPDAKYLTLMTTCADEDHFADHAVWSGARLEVVP